jgi:hypothetical protein
MRKDELLEIFPLIMKRKELKSYLPGACLVIGKDASRYIDVFIKEGTEYGKKLVFYAAERIGLKSLEGLIRQIALSGTRLSRHAIRALKFMGAELSAFTENDDPFIWDILD